eukprot:NODE_690_length_5158_cov_0.250494.p3 type:complete len:157 gc:universal NODE_690_length_5158_cov_0.250494:824-354(-)
MNLSARNKVNSAVSCIITRVTVYIILRNATESIVNIQYHNRFMIIDLRFQFFDALNLNLFDMKVILRNPYFKVIFSQKTFNFWQQFILSSFVLNICYFTIVTHDSTILFTFYSTVFQIGSTQFCKILSARLACLVVISYKYILQITGTNNDRLDLR